MPTDSFESAKETEEHADNITKEMFYHGEGQKRIWRSGMGSLRLSVTGDAEMVRQSGWDATDRGRGSTGESIGGKNAEIESTGETGLTNESERFRKIGKGSASGKYELR